MRIGAFVLVFLLLSGILAGVNGAKASDMKVCQLGANETEQNNGTAYLQGVAHKIMLVLGIVAGVVVAVMWVFVALEFFSPDPDKKAKAKQHAMYAAIGTVIIAMAVSGIIWMLAQWLVA